MRRILLVLVFSMLIVSCKTRHHHIQSAFYYWKTNYAITPYLSECLKKARTKKLYVRCFDVDFFDGKATPVAVIRHLEPSPFRQIPVVFVTQRALNALTPAVVKSLSGNISHLLEQVCAGIPPPTEIQIDCDWTSRSKEAYFALLQALRKEAFFQNRTLSCTIRLHQVKYSASTGIPPVDRGLLMCYNMGNLRQAGNQNSILDLRIAKDYLSSLRTYPLDLDVALPVFSWCLRFHEGHMDGILRDLSPESLAGGPFRQQQKNIYISLADTNWMGYSFAKRDVVRTEVPPLDDIIQMAKYAAQHLRNDSLSVALFHADSLTLSKYSDDDLQAIYAAFR